MAPTKPAPEEPDRPTRKRFLRCCVIVLFCLTASSVDAARGELSPNQARKLIARMPGFELKSSAVRVRTIRSIDAATAEASVEIATVFRLEKGDLQQWRVLEFRTGQDQWQGIEFIMRALKIEESANPCDVAEMAVRQKQPADPTIKRARCLLAELLAVPLPSDDVRIKAVSSMALPLGSKPSATVEAVVTAAFRLRKEAQGWRVSSVRTGTRDWVDPEVILNAVNAAKTASARTELESIAKALEDFRSQRGSYVESKSQTVLVDFLSPRYLSRVIRLDPWRRPYLYEGTRDHFALSSTGPDGKANTSDDIVLSGPNRSAVR